MNLLRRAATTAVVCLALPALAACSGGEATPEVADPTTPTVVTPTQTPTEPPEPVEPELPEAATKKTKAGAVAFVQHYWEMAAYAQATGDTTALKKLGGPFCKACDIGIEAVREVYDADGTMQGGGSSVSDSNVNLLRTEDGKTGYKVNVTLETNPQTVKVPGQKPKQFRGGTAAATFLLDWDDGKWRVGFWEPIDS